ncbi:tectonic-2 [Brienomyrus brachyistius]|uniref:tectonic-2 n=1 Tax=Brienomyrus brachyistius TaxID=42636 RepID=UPI0020B23202|nr:tectonic-2 [Brienomyrus brachyistius]
MTIILHKSLYIILIALITEAYTNVAFQPASITASGPKVTAFLLGNTSGVSLTLNRVQASNITGRLPPPSCGQRDSGQWAITTETLSKSVLKVELILNRSLQLCGNDTDCCPQPLCVLETLRVSACRGDSHQAALLLQAEIYALDLPTGPASYNKTVIPNQVYQPLGPCPCDLTAGTCDILCCCDQDCSPDTQQLFKSQCIPGPFGGSIAPVPDYQCSEQSSRNEPDWFPFLCVTSPPENSPFLGLFYQGEMIVPRRNPSFEGRSPSPALPLSSYRQGDPIFTEDGQYFTIPQRSMVGQCVSNAPVAFLQDFRAWCPGRLQSCPTSPVLRLRVRDGFGGVITVRVEEVLTKDLSPFVSVRGQAGKRSPTESSWFPGKVQASPAEAQQNWSKLCENATLALDYSFFWRANGLTGIVLRRTVGDVPLDPGATLTVWFSAEFVNKNASAQPSPRNPGYIAGKPIIGGSVDRDTGAVRRTPISMWQPVGDGLCASAGKKPVLFGENSTTGCLVLLSMQDLTQCNQLRETIHRGLGDLVTASYVAKNGNPNSFNLDEWVNITHVLLNATTPLEDSVGVCKDVPSHLNIHIFSTVTGQGTSHQIQALEVSYTLSTWRVGCGGGDPRACQDSAITQGFPVSSAVTFINIPAQSRQIKTRFQINYTEYDCDRNDVCWPQLLYPLTRYYTGEPYSISLAKGLILVFFFIAASLLGAPWRQIRQAWSTAIF